MKKEYVNPEMQVVVLNVNQQLLNGSPQGTYDPTSSVDAGSVEASQFFDNGGSEDW